MLNEFKKLKQMKLHFTNYADESNIISDAQLCENIRHIDAYINMNQYDNMEILLDDDKSDEISSLLNSGAYSLSISHTLLDAKRYINDLSEVELSIFEAENLKTIQDYFTILKD